MSARDSILAKIRQSLPNSDEKLRDQAVAERLGSPRRGVIPQRGQLPAPAQRDLFEAMAKNANASVARIKSAKDLPREISRYLRDKNLPAEFRMGDDPVLAAAPWSKEKNLTVHRGATDGSDEVGVSRAIRGVAETGTLALEAGADNPTTLNFLPEHHIVVIEADNIIGELEGVWDHVRETHGKAAMPRVVNLVTGPSRSGDIEQKLLLGAHGPRALHIVIVG